jgi:hypothetical protein
MRYWKAIRAGAAILDGWRPARYTRFVLKSSCSPSALQASVVKGMVMLVIARIIGLSVFTSGLGAVLGYAFCGKGEGWAIISLSLACAGGIIGGVAGAAREIVTALRERPGT